MQLKVGMARQQYQRLESGGNPGLDTLELVAKGLKMELMLIPQEKLQMVRRVLEGTIGSGDTATMGATTSQSPSEDPWEGLLEDDE